MKASRQLETNETLGRTRREAGQRPWWCERERLTDSGAAEEHLRMRGLAGPTGERMRLSSASGLLTAALGVTWDILGGWEHLGWVWLKEE